MKQCPVCSESFSDDLRFCDVDGTRLTRKLDAGESRGSGGLWSMLGAALLVGGLIITGAAIVFFPKTRGVPAAPVTVRTENPSQGTPEKPNEVAQKEPASEVAANAQPADTKVGATTNSGQDASAAQPRKKETSATAGSGGTSVATPDPKAAARVADDSDNTVRKTGAADPSPAKANTGTADAVASKATGSQAKASEAGATTDQSAADAKKDPKRAAKAADKDPNGNKKDEKKGGFFRVFKKIFGKN